MATPASTRESEVLTPRATGDATHAGDPVRQTNLWKDAWYRYIRNRGALIAGIVFALLLLYCIVWPVISP